MDTIVTGKEFEAMLKGDGAPVLVQFWASWCKPCQIMSPVVEDIQKEYGERLRVCRVDVDRCREVVGRYGVVSVPTLLLFVDGQPELRILGFQTKHDLCRQVEGRLRMVPGA